MIKVKWQQSYRTNNANSSNGGRPSPGSLTLSPVIDGVSSMSLARRPPVGTIWEMDTIAEDALPPVGTATSTWSHPLFSLSDTGVVVSRATNARITKDQVRDHGEDVLPDLIRHVHTRMLHELAFCEQAIPPLEFDDRASIDSTFTPNVSLYSSASSSSVRSSSSSICSTADGFRTMVDSDVPRCIFHTSQNFSVAEKLLVFVCSSRGLSCGIWSRSLLLHDGVSIGSMIPFFQAAIAAGYGIVVMNPNMNTQVMETFDANESDGHSSQKATSTFAHSALHRQKATFTKLPIDGSATPEEHVEHVWRKYIFPSAAHKIHFIGYGLGGALVTQLLERYEFELTRRLGNVAFIESSHRASAKWTSAFQRWFSQHCVCWVQARDPLNTDLGTIDRSSSSTGASDNSDTTNDLTTTQVLAFGCLCLSAGTCEGPNKSPAFTANAVRDDVFAFLASPSAYEYQRLAAKSVKRNALRDENERLVLARQTTTTERDVNTTKQSPTSATAKRKTSTGHRLLQRQSSRSCPDPFEAAAANSHIEPVVVLANESVTIDDFQLLRVVGKGAFGKVMLVRRKPTTVSNTNTRSPSNSSTTTVNKVFAMKVIKKAAVFARNQVEHTKTERRVLESVDHPFLVKLRFAFQTSAKLYFVMDFYNGGTLHFHLRRAINFDEHRARFYAAQLVLAVAHLHTYNIVYRDLKPENVLMDDQGFLAITDFGLSRDNFDSKGKALSTFCGTPEYIAPELIRRIPYGRAVDYWSLGVLIFEMLAGYTPFYNANRKRNFENILKLPLKLPTEFSEDAKSLLRGLLCKDPAKRLGSGPVGAREIMEHAFFRPVDWEKLYKRDVDVPFRPIVRRDGEVNNVPEFFRRQDAVDSVVAESVPLGKSHVFTDFSYVDPYQL